MYGGKIETNNGNVTDELWIFNIQSQTWSTKTPAVLVHGQQYAVEGHSAHIVELDSRDVVMIIIFGYSAIYGYTSIIQEYYISKLLLNTFFFPCFETFLFFWFLIRTKLLFIDREAIWQAKTLCFNSWPRNLPPSSPP